jgi:hypothetical protein
MRDKTSNRRSFLQSAADGVGASFLAPAILQSARAAAPPATAKDKVIWKSLFDGKALGDWKSANFSRPGMVFVRDGAIIMERGNQMTGATYSRGDFPKTDYEVALEGKKIDGDDFFCTTTFPVGDSFCSFVVGGWGGTTVGLSSINGSDASENETSTAKEFKRDVWYRIRIRVSPKRIQAWIDDERVVDADIEYRKISIRVECNACKPFGVATWNTTGAVRNIRVRELNSDEKKLSGEKPGNKD